MNTPKIRLIALFFIVAFAIPLQAQQNLDRFRNVEGISVSEWQGREVVHAERKIKIKLHLDANRVQAAASVEHLRLPRYDSVFNQLGWGFFEVEEVGRLFETLEQLAKNPLFEIVEPVFVGELGIVPNDADFSLQWHLNNAGQSPTNGTPGADISARYAWDIITGDSDVIIAILDTGISMQNDQLSHEDLQQVNRFILGPNFTNLGDPEDVGDNHGHGTHVTGIAAAHTNNSTGVAGVNWQSDVMVIQTNRGDNGFYDEAWFFDAVQFASDFADSTGRRVVINFSSGGPDPSQLYIDAIEYAEANDVLIVSISHNDGLNNFVRFPARYSDDYDNVIAVAATDHDDVRAGFSNAGPQVNISAPGGHNTGAGDARNIYSTMPNYPVTMTQHQGFSQNYD